MIAAAKRRLTTTGAVVVGCAFLVSPPPGPVAGQPPVAPALTGPAPPPLPYENDFPSFQGRVIAIGGGAITVQGIPAWVNGADPLTQEERRQDFANHRWTNRGGRMTVFIPGRAVVCREAILTRETATITDLAGAVTVIRRADEPLRRFRLAKELIDGGVGPERVIRLEWVAYRLADLRVGDEVRIDLKPENGQRVVGVIVIERRPNGRVPAAPHEPLIQRLLAERGPDTSVEDVLKLTPYHHDRMNALQDWEQGVPLPEPFRTLYADRLPEDVPVAPPPRELPPRIPTATP